MIYDFWTPVYWLPLSNNLHLFECTFTITLNFTSFINFLQKLSSIWYFFFKKGISDSQSDGFFIEWWFTTLFWNEEINHIPHAKLLISISNTELILFSGGSSNLNSHPSTKFDYAKALKLSILFFDAQRSGRLPSNNPIPWRSDSAVNDNGDGHDLSGGWYDGRFHNWYYSVTCLIQLGDQKKMLDWAILHYMCNL